MLPHASDIVDLKGNILNSVTVFDQVCLDLSQLAAVLFGHVLVGGDVLGPGYWGSQHEASVPVGNDIGSCQVRSGFRFAVCNNAEAEVSDEVGGSLTGIAQIPGDIIEASVVGIELLITAKLGGTLDGSPSTPVKRMLCK